MKNAFAETRLQHGWTTFSLYSDNHNKMTRDVCTSVSFSMTSFARGGGGISTTTTTNDGSMDALEEDTNGGSGWSRLDHQDTNPSSDANDAGENEDSSEIWLTHLFPSSSSSSSLPKSSPATEVPSSCLSSKPSKITRRGVLPPPRTCPISYQQAYYYLNRTQATRKTTRRGVLPPPRTCPISYQQAYDFLNRTQTTTTTTTLEDTRFLTNDEWMKRRERRYRSLSRIPTTTTTSTTTTHRRAPMPHLLVSEQGQTPPVTSMHSENSGVDQVLDYSAGSTSLPHHDDEEEEEERQWRDPIRRAQRARSRVELLQHRSSIVSRTCRKMIHLPWHIFCHSESRIHRARAASATTTTTTFREEGARSRTSRTWNNQPPPPTTSGGRPTLVPTMTTTTTTFEWPDELELRHGDNDDTATAYWSTGTRMCDDLSYGSSSNNEGA
jgi:hypothetical protein